jgi:hypothetical protein
MRQRDAMWPVMDGLLYGCCLATRRNVARYGWLTLRLLLGAGQWSEGGSYTPFSAKWRLRELQSANRDKGGASLLVDLPLVLPPTRSVRRDWLSLFLQPESPVARARGPADASSRAGRGLAGWDTPLPEAPPGVRADWLVPPSKPALVGSRAGVLADWFVAPSPLPSPALNSWL